jgi:dihydroxyacetone kinase-like predicted kinase
MNPAVEDFLAAVHACKAEHYIILPNNKNVVLAASQTQKLIGDSVTVLPSVNMPQAIAALTAFDSDKTYEANLAAMTQRMSSVKAASLTVAVRDSQTEGRLVSAGRFIGLLEGKIVTDAETIDTALSALIAKLITPQTEVVSLYYGSDVSAGEAERLRALLAQRFSTIQTELYNGGQPYYHFILSAE